ncbi:MAG: hypothetical protein V4714_14365 [Bacteroidota bacterium]
MKKKILFLCLLISVGTQAQTVVNTSSYDKSSAAKLTVKGNALNIDWPVSKTERGKLMLDLEKGKPLFKSIQMGSKGQFQEIAAQLDPAFILTVGKRDLVSQNGWNIFFDNMPKKPRQSYTIDFEKTTASVSTVGAQTVIRVSELHAASFTGALEITLYNGSPLFNVAAVVATDIDSTAILYDAGLVSKTPAWETIAWSDTKNQLQTAKPNVAEASKNLEVKYRTVIGENKGGSLALFPAPHQYFYPLDEAFNLKFTWYGANYRDMIPNFGIGIRQDLEGDKRWVPWFNAPPKTQQRLNFFCLLSNTPAAPLLEEVKKYTHSDVYPVIPGYKRMASHFHNEFIMQVVLAGKPVPEKPTFVEVFKNTGIDIVHLGEFHYTAHPKGPDAQRLIELKALFDQCQRLSDKDFLLLPGEEPNEFLGGHWMNIFPKPVYWIMSRKPEMPFVTDDPLYGKVYRIADKTEMLQLLEQEKGLAWTAHARTKGSTGFPDAYKNEAFFQSDRFLGAAWKAIPGDLSQPRLSRRVLDLMDDMNNWGLKKHVIAEADLFTIEHENEMYAHLNVNYLKLAQLPDFKTGWQPVLDAMEKGQFFSSTGEVLLPSFQVNGKGAGETVQLATDGKATIALEINWTFPLNFVEIISGDGKQVYREKIDLTKTQAFGKKQFSFPTNLKNRTWVRVEVWDAAVNGAFTQSVWLH